MPQKKKAVYDQGLQVGYKILHLTFKVVMWRFTHNTFVDVHSDSMKIPLCYTSIEEWITMMSVS